MSENSSVESESTNKTIDAGSLRTKHPGADGIGLAVTFCAAGLTLTFFLPWLNVLFIKPSGLQFARDGGMANLLWALPFFSVFTVIGGIVKQGQRVIGPIAGLIPFAILAFALSKDGANLFQSLEPAAWVALGLGGLLVVLAPQVQSGR